MPSWLRLRDRGEYLSKAIEHYRQALKADPTFG
jgi:hypothetical protein